MDDERIVELFLKRDEAAITAAAEKYGSALRSIARGILKDAHAAEECENDVYLEAWRLIPPNEPRTYLFAFLGRIARHVAIDRCRRNSVLKRKAQYCELTAEMEECIPGSGGVESELEAGELSEAISEYLNACSRERRDVFVRRYWFFDSVPEICARYGFSRSKVKTMLFRMRQELKQHLEKEGYTV